MIKGGFYSTLKSTTLQFLLKIQAQICYKANVCWSWATWTYPKVVMLGSCFEFCCYGGNKFPLLWKQFTLGDFNCRCESERDLGSWWEVWCHWRICRKTATGRDDASAVVFHRFNRGSVFYNAGRLISGQTYVSLSYPQSRVNWQFSEEIKKLKILLDNNKKMY